MNSCILIKSFPDNPFVLRGIHIEFGAYGCGDPVTAPGIPPDFPNPKSLITDDCIRPAKL